MDYQPMPIFQPEIEEDKVIKYTPRSHLGSREKQESQDPKLQGNREN